MRDLVKDFGLTQTAGASWCARRIFGKQKKAARLQLCRPETNVALKEH